MLSELHVRNFALIGQADLEFREGLTVLSGETGAGKSILIDSIAAALGAKTGKGLIRTGAEYAYIELLFSVTGEERLSRIRELGIMPEEDGTLIITRKIMKKRSVLRVNDEAVTAGLLRELTEQLIDIHGQHEHQTLLYPERHLAFVDLMAPEELEEKKAEARRLYARWSELKKILSREADESFREREKEILQYEIAEIRDAALKEGEEEALAQEFQRLRNASRISDALSEAADALDTDAVSRAVRRVSDAAEYDPALKDLLDQVSELDSLLTDARRAAADAAGEVTFDEARLNAVAGRLDLIRRLEDKYGVPVPGIAELLEKKEERLQFLMEFEKNRDEMAAEKRHLGERLAEVSAELTKIRRRTAAELEKQITDQLTSLNFRGAVFEIRLTETAEPGPEGRDRAEFWITTNPGEPLKPLKNVASGGELSRIMLALKTVLADRDEIGTLIFDEIDTGISGRTAQMVSEKLSRIGRSHQVLCITHLPQIAAMADHHCLIEKQSDGARTETSIREIRGEEITTELARLIGGTEITPGVLSTASEMKALAEQKKAEI